MVMKNKVSNITAKGLLFTILAVLGQSCTSDAWEDHYRTESGQISTITLWDQLEGIDEVSEFRTLLDSVKVMNGKKLTAISYAELLKMQFFTVFAPVNGSFNLDSLLSLCTTSEGNRQVERFFVMSHLSRTPQSHSSYVDRKATMYNGKKLVFKQGSLSGVPIIESKSNLLARNGMVHCVEGPIPYVFNVYESILYMPELEGMGAFVLPYQKDSLDERTSVVEGIQDGLTVYVDSVMIEKNELLYYFGPINAEDSTFHMIAPSKTAWDAVYAEASTYFNYGSITGADKLQDYWTNFSLMKDLFFNWNLQESPQDSLVSTQYNKYRAEKKRHVFFNPYDEGGILSNIKETVPVSNGVVYTMDEWPFTFDEVFYFPIEVEVEYEEYIKEFNAAKFTYTPRQKYADSISNDGYLYVRPIKNTEQPVITFYIPNTLSGKYNVSVVLLPKTVHNPLTTDFKPNKISGVLSFYDESGNLQNQSCRGLEGTTPVAFHSNDPYRVDTVGLTTVDFPTCNYAQETITVSLRIQSAVSARELTRFSHEMYIDCILLEPITTKPDNNEE